jgi:hypothetical protein
MNKEFIPYEQALELKELGFDEPCMAFYELNNREVMVVGVSQRYNDPSLLTITDFCAPLYQQAFRWFREKYGLDYEITYAGKKGEYHAFSVEYIYGNNGSSPSIFSYEEAELACLKKLIIIVERKPEAYS